MQSLVVSFTASPGSGVFQTINEHYAFARPANAAIVFVCNRTGKDRYCQHSPKRAIW